MLSLFKKNENFLLACFIATLGSLGNVIHAVLLKYYSAKLSVNLYELVFLNCIVEIIVLFPFCIKNIFSTKSKQQIFIVILLAILYSMDILLYNTGLKTVSINTGTLIMLLVPLWMCFFGKVILKEHGFDMINAICLLLCIFAVIITIYGDIKIDHFSIGVLLIFINSIVLPIGVILQKKFSDTRPIIYALWSNAFMLGLFSFFLSGCSVDIIKNINIDKIVGAIIIAMSDMMECGGVYLSCKLAKVSSLQPIRFTRIIFAILISRIILGENTTYHQIIGISIILISNFASIIYSKKKHYSN